MCGRLKGKWITKGAFKNKCTWSTRTECDNTWSWVATEVPVPKCGDELYTKLKKWNELCQIGSWITSPLECEKAVAQCEGDGTCKGSLSCKNPDLKVNPDIKYRPFIVNDSSLPYGCQYFKDNTGQGKSGVIFNKA